MCDFMIFDIQWRAILSEDGASRELMLTPKLHVLSTYMGHVKPADTYWYLSATPEMLGLSCLKYETHFGGSLDES